MRRTRSITGATVAENISGDHDQPKGSRLYTNEIPPTLKPSSRSAQDGNETDLNADFRSSFTIQSLRHDARSRAVGYRTVESRRHTFIGRRSIHTRGLTPEGRKINESLLATTFGSIAPNTRSSARSTSTARNSASDQAESDVAKPDENAGVSELKIELALKRSGGCTGGGGGDEA